MRNIYKDLGVSRNCSVSEARKACSAIIDKFPKDSKESILAKKAFNIIKDEDRRKAYDDKLRQSSHKNKPDSNPTVGRFEDKNSKPVDNSNIRGKFEAADTKQFVAKSIDKNNKTTKTTKTVQSVPRSKIIGRNIVALALVGAIFGAGYLFNDYLEEDTIDNDIPSDNSLQVTEAYKEDFYRFIRIYRVQENDTVEDLMKQANCTMDDICEINGVGSGFLDLKPGYVTLIPYYVSPEDLNFVVNVQEIENPTSLSSFSASHDTLPYTMEMLNPNLTTTTNENGEVMISGTCVVPDWLAMEKNNSMNIKNGVSQIKNTGDIQTISK